jgi:hypothetical protein
VDSTKQIASEKAKVEVNFYLRRPILSSAHLRIIWGKPQAGWLKINIDAFFSAVDCVTQNVIHWEGSFVTKGSIVSVAWILIGCCSSWLKLKLKFLKGPDRLQPSKPLLSLKLSVSMLSTFLSLKDVV